MAEPSYFGELPDTSRLKALLIDLDNTIYAYAPAHKVALEASHDWFRRLVEMDASTFARRYREVRQQVTDRLHPQGACRSRLFAFQALCEAEKVAVPHRAAYALDECYWSTFLDHMHIHPVPARIIDRCAAAGTPICIVSDMTAHVQVRKLDRLGIMDHIAFLVTSEELGCEKPDPRLFRTALGKLGIEARDTLMIGDDLRKDIEGARAVGIDAWRFVADGVL